MDDVRLRLRWICLLFCGIAYMHTHDHPPALSTLTHSPLPALPALSHISATTRSAQAIFVHMSSISSSARFRVRLASAPTL